MREWLQTQADKRSIPNMRWYNREHTMILIPWKHGSRSGWTIEDSQLYRAWAQYTGKCSSNSVDEPKRWKANFRCALNSLHDVREVRHLCQMRGKDPYKVYEFLHVDAARKGNMKRRRRCRRDRAGHMNVDHDDDVMPSSCRTRLPSYVEQETAQSTDDDDQQLPLLEESVVIDRTSTEPLMPMEELLSMSQPAACPVAVSRYLNLQSSCLDISHNTIPTVVTEMGETMMNELDDSAEIFSTVDSLDSGQWSATPSPVSDSSDAFTYYNTSHMLDDTLTIIQADNLNMIPSWSHTDVTCLLSPDITSDYVQLTYLRSDDIITHHGQ